MGINWDLFEVGFGFDLSLGLGLGFEFKNAIRLGICLGFVWVCKMEMRVGFVQIFVRI